MLSSLVSRLMVTVVDQPVLIPVGHGLRTVAAMEVSNSFRKRR